MIPIIRGKCTILVRNFSAKSKNVELIKNLNFENKSLYGPVIKQKKRKVKGGKVKNAVNVTNPNESPRSSEMFWLAGGSQDLRFEENSAEIEVSTPNFNSIPFHEEDLEKITKFPFRYEANYNLFDSKMPNYNTKLPSVGKILAATMPETSREALIKWKLTQIEKLGEVGFKELEKSHLTKGKLMHNTIDEYLTTGAEPTKESEVYKLWESVRNVLKDFRSKENHPEVQVEHPVLKYCGIADCVSLGKSNISVLEFKKSDRIKNDIHQTYDAPVQLCAYTGALNFNRMYSQTIRNGFVIVGYSNGSPANVYELSEFDMKKYWRIWLQRLQQFWIMTRDGTLPEPI